jgi:hypothetical protein
MTLTPGREMSRTRSNNQLGDRERTPPLQQPDRPSTAPSRPFGPRRFARWSPGVAASS